MNFVQELAGGSAAANLVTGGIDELIGRKEATGSVYPLTDALGSVMGLTDAAGVLQTQYSYEPYGKTTVSGAASGNSQTYTGRENDGTGLFYYRARYYLPGMGRFVSEDSAGLAGGINSYAYVSGNPTAYVDPSGNFFFPALALMGSFMSGYGFGSAGVAWSNGRDQAASGRDAMNNQLSAAANGSGSFNADAAQGSQADMYRGGLGMATGAGEAEAQSLALLTKLKIKEDWEIIEEALWERAMKMARLTRAILLAAIFVSILAIVAVWQFLINGAIELESLRNTIDKVSIALRHSDTSAESLRHFTSALIQSLTGLTVMYQAVAWFAASIATLNAILLFAIQWTLRKQVALEKA